jgi:hypothetical protein
MSSDPRLENYLASLESALRPLPVSDRAEIITEIKSHVISALEREPETQLDVILRNLGEPETVANRYLLERGLKAAKPPISPIVKWLVIGFLGSIAMFLVFVGFVISRFTPLVHVDDSDGRVALMGGLLQIDGDKENFSFNINAHNFSGSNEITAGQEIKIKFNSGKFDISTSDRVLTWNCRGSSKGSPIKSAMKNEFALDFSSMRGIKCELGIPKNSNMKIDGTNGKLDFENPDFSIAATLTNGKVTLSPIESQAYKYDLNVEHGSSEEFISSGKPDAHRISIHIDNGKISR